MKHIGSNESSVLQEYFRIAHEQGFIKEAQDVPVGEVAQPAPVQPAQPDASYQKPDIARMTTDDATLAALLKKYPDVSNVVAGARPKGGLQGVYNQMKSLFTELKASVTKANYPRLAKSVLDPIGKYFAANLSKRQLPQVQQQMGRLIQNDDDGMYADATTKNEQTKEAKEDSSKYYDVTGETGEQLVEKAHPGGGTRTELTHSKTDENLVETIVEQQERDLEVARKAPKGTYATLVKLYGDLSKMGHKDKLDDLKDLIYRVATIEDIVEHTLVRLADKLDKLGHNKAADEVDSLLKKKA